MDVRMGLVGRSSPRFSVVSSKPDPHLIVP
jgi:hypothetical protein